MSDESEVQQHIQIEASKLGNKLFRNNSGATKDATGRVIYYGLGVISSQQNKYFKSSDLIGFTPIVITPEMVGRKLAVFTAVEVKKTKWKYMATEREIAQLKFLDVVKMNGGIGIFCNSIDSYKKAIIDFIFMR